VCDKTCIFFFFLITNKYFLMAKRSLLSRCPSYANIKFHEYPFSGSRVVPCGRTGRKTWHN